MIKQVNHVIMKRYFYRELYEILISMKNNGRWHFSLQNLACLKGNAYLCNIIYNLKT